MQKVYDEMGVVEDKITATNSWEVDREIEIAMTVMNLPDADADVTMLSGGEKRRVALCKLLLTKAGLAPAGRADKPLGRGLCQLAGAYFG